EMSSGKCTAGSPELSIIQFGKREAVKMSISMYRTDSWEYFSEISLSDYSGIIDNPAIID
ncbi:hypothetical protein ACSTI1_00085, partial [Vibrio parahaemolyticus]